MSYGQGGQGQPPWDPWNSGSQRPQWGSQTDDRTPDWAALADASESRNKRRRVLLISGGALATVAVGVAVAVAVVSANGSSQASNSPSNLPPTADIPSDVTAPEPSFAPTSAPPPLDPKDFISSVKKDTAPLSPGLLFPGSTLTMGDRVYTKGPTADTTNCAAAAKGTLATVLTKNKCTRLLRVTYSKDGMAVTVGVAVFDTEAQAAKAKGDADAKSIIASLAGGKVKPFCDSAVCRSTTNSYGRYAYFTLAGFTNGKDVTTKDTTVFTTGDDLAEFTFRQIRRRGEAQASTAANE
ncbi:hypothetical protein [Streptomyces sp. NBC_00038]|uniref:hypothetical protein n=1 Tax=Streptomyces sp. NBC_00038 TaxID=2903615 RepID=UPI002258CFEF|nr:hypothetical protein [Streptomyces sp. NBC_00038]MCX5560054.1 hypothetical protein [Streptomyces sp. NBC_00038]